MKGTNKIAKLEHDKDGSVLDVKEIFLTIQGEGPYSGMPAVFLRLAGCGLSCSFCFGWRDCYGRQPIVTMLGRDNKRMGEVVAGDKLLTLDDFGQSVETEVRRVHTREVDEWVELSVQGKEYAVTPEHPFFTSRGLVEARELRAGDEVQCRDPANYLLCGPTVKKVYRAVLVQKSLEPLRVTNFTCSPYNTFLADGMWVHNCDTDFENGTSMPIGDILSEIGKSIGHWSGPRLVVLTGGEPLRQNILPLCELLLSANFLIQIETAGYCWPSGFGSRFDTHLRTKAIHLVCSPKTPKVHPKVEKYCRDWKYIVARDTEFAVPAVEGNSVYQADRQSNNIWVQPRDDGDETYNRLNVEKAIALCTSFGYRLSLQTHKILGLP